MNFPDVLMCRGQYQVQPPLPYAPGVELCGKVVGTGARVVGSPVLPTGGPTEYALLESDAVLAPRAPRPWRPAIGS